jgi:glycosyltransferase involved in cell wall biosynthesis
MKKVLHVIEAYGNSGISIAARQCAQAIRKKGWGVAFLAIYYLKDLDPEFARFKTSWKELATPWRLAKLFDRFDVVHHHTPNFGHVQYFTGRPSVFHVWGLSPRVYGSEQTYVYTPSGGFHYRSETTVRRQILDLYYDVMLRRFAKKYSSIIAISQFCKYEAKLILRTDNVELVYIGVNTESFKPGLEGRFRRGKPQYLFVGDLSPRKGVEVLIYGMKELIKVKPNAHLMILGDGVLKQYLTNLIVDLGLSGNVQLVGFVPHHDIPYYYASCDAYVTADRRSYFPQPVLEAMASGKPVVVPNLHVYPEIMAESRAGLMYRWDDPKGLSKSMVEILDLDLKRSAIEYAKRFTWDNAAEKIVQIYERCLASP